MRKIVLFFSLVTMVAMCGKMQAQNARIGVKLGPTLDWVSPGSTAVSNEGVGVGFNIGLVYDQDVASHLAFSTGVNCNFLRLKYMFTDYRFIDGFLEPTNVQVSRRLRATNIEVPLKVKFKMDVASSLKAFAEAGVGIGFNTHDLAKDAYDFYWESESATDYEDYTSQYRLLQASMIFGLGTEIEINKDLSAFVQLTFDHAFSNAFVKSLAEQTGSVVRNNYLGIEVGILH